MTNDTLKQYCQIFETTCLFIKTTKRLHVRHYVQNNNNKNNKILALQLLYKAVKLCTTTFWVILKCSSIQKHAYSI
jgi:hypothetical protein